jgi:predicted permease
VSRPPGLAERILSALLPSAEREEILGDLSEAYAARSAEGRRSAKLWYWTQVVLVPMWLVGSSVNATRIEGAHLRRAVRGLARSPGFTLVAVLSLGLGIGATTAISGALKALLFDTLPVDRPDELSLVYHTWPEVWEGGQYGSGNAVDPVDGADVASNVSYPAFRSAQQAVGDSPDGTHLAGYAFVREMSVVIGDAPALAAGGMLVSGNYFETLRLGTALGRPLGEDDDVQGGRTAVISHSWWLRAFGGDPGVVGREVLLNGRPFTVVGVAQKGYVGLSPGGFFGPSDVIVPLGAAEGFLRPFGEGGSPFDQPLVHWVRLLSRTPSDVSATPIREAVTTAVRANMVENGVIAEAVAGEMEMRFLEGRRGLDSLSEDLEGPLRILSLVVAVVLLIACANLTTLLLARGTARTSETALRRAIGASRWELARPQLLESAILGTLGCAVGIVAALWAGPLLVSVLTDGAGNAAVGYEIDLVLLGTAVGAALFAAGVSGWIPALRLTRADPSSQLGTRSQGGAADRFRLGRVLVAAQIAISVPLVVAAGLLLSTLGNLTAVDPGFDHRNLVVFGVDAGHATRDRTEQDAIYERILTDLAALEGVQAASIVENVLVSGWRSNSNADVDGESVMLDMNGVSPDFLETMRIELVRGRMVDASDGPGAPSTVVVNETAEREVFGGDAIGRTFTIAETPYEVVGVVADTKYSSLKSDIRPGFIQNWTQRSGGLWTVNYVARTTRSPAEIEAVVRDLVASADPRLPVTRFRSQGDELERQASRERVFAELLTLFAGFALLLSCIGLHGVISFAVAQRRAEMGVRLALGAAPVSIVRMVLVQVLRLTAYGLVVGLVIAWQVSPVVGSMLFGVDPGDPRTMLTAAALMAAVALGAGFLPAWRASRVDPLRSLAPRGGG